MMLFRPEFSFLTHTPLAGPSKRINRDGLTRRLSFFFVQYLSNFYRRSISFFFYRLYDGMFIIVHKHAVARAERNLSRIPMYVFATLERASVF